MTALRKEEMVRQRAELARQRSDKERAAAERREVAAEVKAIKSFLYKEAERQAAQRKIEHLHAVAYKMPASALALGRTLKSDAIIKAEAKIQAVTHLAPSSCDSAAFDDDQLLAHVRALKEALAEHRSGSFPLHHESSCHFEPSHHHELSEPKHIARQLEASDLSDRPGSAPRGGGLSASRGPPSSAPAWCVDYYLDTIIRQHVARLSIDHYLDAIRELAPPPISVDSDCEADISQNSAHLSQSSSSSASSSTTTSSLDDDEPSSE